MSLVIKAQTPDGWKAINNNDVISIAPGQSESYNVTLIKLPSATAYWVPVRVALSFANKSDTEYYQYYVKTDVVNRFSLKALNDELIVDEKEKVADVQFRLKNRGNAAENFHINVNIRTLKIDINDKLTLLPGQDSIMSYKLKIRPDVFSTIRNENIQIIVANSLGEKSALIYHLGKLSSIVNQHNSAYNVLPLRVDIGVMNYADKFAFSGGLSGNILLGKDQSLGFNYRSKQLGPAANGIQQNVYAVNYKYKKFGLYLGQMSEAGYFMTLGNGAKVSYKKNDRTEFSLAGSLHNSNFYFYDDNITGNIKYPVGKITITQTAVANFNAHLKKNSYLFYNKVDLISKDNMHLSVKGGVGQDFYTQTGPKPKEVLAGSGGYNFDANLKAGITIASSYLYGSNYFPGNYKGLTTHYHIITKNFNNTYIGLFYEYNRTTVNYFRDTLYNSDFLSFNIEKYGFATGLTSKRSGVNARIGKLRQRSYFNIEMPNMSFGELNYGYKVSRHLQANVGGSLGYSSRFNDRDADVYMVNATGSVNTEWGGIRAIYTKQPFPVLDGSFRYLETMNISPYAKFYLFNRRVYGNFQYNMSKSADDTAFRSALGGNLNYNNNKCKCGISVSSFIPLGNSVSGNNNYYQRSTLINFHKDINVPIISKKKYYDMKFVFYHDINNNGKRDKEDVILDNMQMKIGDVILISDEHGIAKYNNVDPGKYVLELYDVKGKDNLIPKLGPKQTVMLTKDMVIDVPFKVGKMVTGVIKVGLDTFSSKSFGSQNIKVTAVDTFGQTYTTLTDKDGFFYFYLPSNNYIVSLNPEAFEGGDFKPAQLAYNVDLNDFNESILLIEIKQKTRKVRFLDPKF